MRPEQIVCAKCGNPVEKTEWWDDLETGERVLRVYCHGATDEMRLTRQFLFWRMKMDWFGFWIFLAVFVACDHWIFAQGYDSFFQRHKTDAEKELQRLKIEELRRKVEASNA